MRADAPIEIAVDIVKAVEAGVDFIVTDSDAILTAQHVPNTAILWVVDDKNATTIWTAPEVEDKKEERQVVVEGSSSSAVHQAKNEKLAHSLRGASKGRI